MLQINVNRQFAGLLLTILIASCSFMSIETPLDVQPKAPKIIAHCGYWDVDGAAENSIASLKNAGEIGVYASEFDIQLTSDDNIVVCHNPTINGINIHETSLSDIRNSNCRLSNGELMPTLDEYFQEALRYPELFLVLELKSNGEIDYENRVIAACVNKINNYKISERIIFISFSLTACLNLKKYFKNNIVLYLGGDKNPKELSKLGLDGLNCHYSFYNSHHDWIDDMIKLDMYAGVWTVDDSENIIKLIKQGVEFITTNTPVMALDCAAEYAKITHDRKCI